MKKLKCGIITLALLGALHLPVWGASKYITKQVQYLNPTFKYNGGYKMLQVKPVKIDDRIYIPIRALGEATGLAVDWRNNELEVMNRESVSSYSMKAEIQDKTAQIRALTQEVEDLKNELGIIKGTQVDSHNTSHQTVGDNISKTELSATRRDLEDFYSDYFTDIDFDFNVSLSSNRVIVSIDYDTSIENKRFQELSTSRIKSFISDVCEEIRMHHGAITIRGTISYKDSSQYGFSYSTADRLDYWGY